MPCLAIINNALQHRRFIQLLLFSAFLAIFFSCGSVDDPNFDFSTVEQGTDSALVLDAAQVYKITSQTEWDDFWAQHKANITPLPEQPAVDLTQQMVVAVVDMIEPSGGYSMEITQIKERLERLAVFATRTIPSDECGNAAALTSPFHIVSLEQSNLEPKLFITDTISYCSP